MRQAAAIHPFLGVVLLVDAASLDNTPQCALPTGVQYLAQPATRDSLRSSIRRALEQQTARRGADPAAPSRTLVPDPAAPSRTIVAGRDRPDASSTHGPMIAASKALREVLELVRRSAPTDAAVLIHGEPDTGKELMAREIHRQSPRAGGPFVRVACGALRESEVAQRLFGPGPRELDGGGASSSLLEGARGGTLFLHNVAELPLWTQVRLLDALQQGQDARGPNQGRETFDLRVIASSTTDLQSAMAKRTFLPSLYYFLSVVPIHVPPLRHRAQDVPTTGGVVPGRGQRRAGTLARQRPLPLRRGDLGLPPATRLAGQ